MKTVSSYPKATVFPAHSHPSFFGHAQGLAGNPEALKEFLLHADATNDIFHLAAQSVAALALRASQLLPETRARGLSEEDARGEALFQAWAPFYAAFRKVWWESMSRPDDLSPEDEADFRASVKKLAGDSADKLRAALPRQAEEYPALFSLDLFALVIGVFELNNLNIMVENPMENYFLFVDGLEGAEHAEATAITGAERRRHGPGAEI